MKHFSFIRSLRTALYLGLLAPPALYAAPVHAQAVQDITESGLASITLPDGAKQVAPKAIPHEITDGLRTLIKASGDSVKQGCTEVMGWSGAGYKKSKAAQYKAKIAANLKNAGWTYEEGDKLEGAQDATMMSAVKLFLLAKRWLASRCPPMTPSFWPGPKCCPPKVRLPQPITKLMITTPRPHKCPLDQQPPIPRPRARPPLKSATFKPRST